METSCNQASVCLILNYRRIFVGLLGLVSDLLLRCFGVAKTGASPLGSLIPSSKNPYKFSPSKAIG